MKTLVLLLLCGFAFAQPPAKIRYLGPPLKKSNCGVERWKIKTLGDAEAANVYYSRPVEMQIRTLRTLPAPARADLDAATDRRFSPVETTKYRVHALLLEYKLETDSDYHLVIADPADRTLTMIAEIPSGDCVDSKMLAGQMTNLRTWLERQWGKPEIVGRMIHVAMGGAPPTAGQMVTIEGIGFFDFDHHQTGVAPNAIELHPVLSISREGIPNR